MQTTLFLILVVAALTSADMFDDVDTNGDGFIDKEEAAAFFTPEVQAAMGATISYEVDSVFDNFDNDHDGLMNREEVAAAAGLVSDISSDYGNHH